ncbi:MAG: AlwI family type II restriction endonuclease [Eubacterium sp.]|nr:AlwI family type II restriction endonuclease [Eubacterium sp.]
MPYEELTYKSFCWCLGTTSFRTENFNLKIEQQLRLLDKFWSLHPEKDFSWSGNDYVQEKYYEFMQESGFVKGDAPRKDKDAREKTSGLVDIGLIDADRKLTNAGKALLDISLSGDFAPDNGLMLPKDSFIFFKQLLKTCNDVDGNQVRPLLVLAYLLSKLDYLTLDEATYLMPLCITKEITVDMVSKIKAVRQGKLTIDEVIYSIIMSMDNYKKALKILLNNSVTEDLICHIGINRKSRKYDAPYFKLYTSLKDVVLEHNESAIIDVYKAIKNIKLGSWWKKLLFGTATERTVKNAPKKALKKAQIIRSKNEDDFKKEFFRLLHLFKAKATLHDYLDLNRRYFKATDAVIFEDDKVSFDIIPKHFLNSILDELFEYAFKSSDNLLENCSLTEIAPCLVIKESSIIKGINKELGLNVKSIDEARKAVQDNRHKRFNELINKQFTDEKLIELLECFEERKDKQIMESVTNNADIPTIFEYILGVIWYKVSEHKGNILDYMNLSLEADLLPKTHAGGGEADIEYWYEACKEYPEHCMLLEVTLADGTNQRRMEMEPVSRHLGEHILKHGNTKSYCVFSTTYLDRNVISDFRNRKTYEYLSKDMTNSVKGMKIIPLQTSEIKAIIKNHITYKKLYGIFEEAFQSDESVQDWYKKAIINSIITM